MKNIFIFLLFISLIHISFLNQIIFPFEEYSYSNNPERKYNDPQSFFIDQYITNIYTVSKIGTPEQSLLTFIESDNCIFQIYLNTLCNNKTEYNYNYKTSTTFQNITKINGNYFYMGTSLINETIKFCLDEKCNKLKTMDNFQINYSNNIGDNQIICSKFGLSVTTREENTWIRVINQLKTQNIISRLVFTIKYISDYNGYIYVGEFPHIYNSTYYFEEQNMTTYIKMDDQSTCLLPKLDMDEIFLNINDTILYMKNKYTIFYFDYGLIIGTSNYLDNINKYFFNKYYNDKTCKEVYFFVPGKSFSGISCKSTDDFKIEEFPTLFLLRRDLNYTFELDYKDLFRKDGDNYYFLIIFDQLNLNTWKLGKPFFKKYQMTFDIDSKSIIFYNEEIKPSKSGPTNTSTDTDNYNIILIVIISVGAFIVICGLVFFAYYLGKILNNQRKKRANELEDDDYEYFSKKENGDKNEDKGLFKEDS